MGELHLRTGFRRPARSSASGNAPRASARRCKSGMGRFGLNTLRRACRNLDRLPRRGTASSLWRMSSRMPYWHSMEMTKSRSVKPVVWIGSSKSDLAWFPEDVIGCALSIAAKRRLRMFGGARRCCNQNSRSEFLILVPGTAAINWHRKANQWTFIS